ncbi:Hypothetical protein R9X50_00042500 [Acrodontium crateriforme]|uniref:Zn(2)-C6 fungal-type domain-containing protein n=1 Tax=Acrodontium crateriforme TaxID=150365 RepID=A0AAQ3R6V9_9PEZI|nr:Hypothetical protein R9X50_00042500 [Acrodontium crateriforme]
MLVNRTNLRSRGCHTCINRRVKCDETLPSLPCFLANFTSPGSARRPGHLDFILDIVRSEWHRNTAFRDASMVAAVTYFMRGRERNDLRPQACYLYGTAPQSLRLKLQARDTSDDEAVLAAIVLLSRLEIITGNSPTASNPHHQAAGKFISKCSAKAYFLSRMGRIAFFIRTEAIIRQIYFSKSTPSLIMSKLPDSIRSWAGILPLAGNACGELHDAISHQSDELSLAAAI